MSEIKRSLSVWDGLAMVVGIVVGSGIFRTPGIVAAQLGRPALTFVAWLAGGLLALVGALIFAELATRYPQAGGKYVYAREAFGPRAAFVAGWVEALIYAAAIAAIGTVAGEYLGRLFGLAPDHTTWLASAVVILLTPVNLSGVTMGRWLQDVVTAAKVVALAGVVVVALIAGSGAGWRTSLPSAPRGIALWGALAISFQSVIWTYYGYVDAAKIAEEVRDPDRTLPRVFLVGIATVIGLYLLLNAAFLTVLPFGQIAASRLVAGDVAAAIFGARGGVIVALLALLVVLASLNGNIFVTPRVIFGLARDGLAPRVFARINTGGTPWAAMLLIGAAAVALTATGTFESIVGLAITEVLLLDGFVVVALFRLRAAQPQAPFRVPWYPVLPLAFLAVYGALFAATLREQPLTAVLSGGVITAVGVLSVVVVRPTAKR